MPVAGLVECEPYCMLGFVVGGLPDSEAELRDRGSGIQRDVRNAHGSRLAISSCPCLGQSCLGQRVVAEYPCAAATLSDRSRPSCVLRPDPRPGTVATASFHPLSANATTYGSVALVSA